jgi:hypothetical protein
MQQVKQGLEKPKNEEKIQQSSQNCTQQSDSTNILSNNHHSFLPEKERKRLLRFFILFIAFLNPLILTITQIIFWNDYEGFSFPFVLMILVYVGLQLIFLHTFRRIFNGYEDQKMTLFKFFLALVAFVNPCLLLIFLVILWNREGAYTGIEAVIWIIFMGMQFFTLYHFKRTFKES